MQSAALCRVAAAVPAACSSRYNKGAINQSTSQGCRSKWHGLGGRCHTCSAWGACWEEKAEEEGDWRCWPLLAQLCGRGRAGRLAKLHSKNRWNESRTKQRAHPRWVGRSNAMLTPCCPAARPFCGQRGRGEGWLGRRQRGNVGMHGIAPAVHHASAGRQHVLRTRTQQSSCSNTGSRPSGAPPGRKRWTPLQWRSLRTGGWSRAARCTCWHMGPCSSEMACNLGIYLSHHNTALRRTRRHVLHPPAGMPAGLPAECAWAMELLACRGRSRVCLPPPCSATAAARGAAAAGPHRVKGNTPGNSVP